MARHTPGEAHVEHDDAGSEVVHHAQCLLTGRDIHRDEAFAPQDIHEQRTHPIVVVDYECPPTARLRYQLISPGRMCPKAVLPCSHT